MIPEGLSPESGSITGQSFPKSSILRRALRDILQRSDASKAEVIRAGVDLTFAARADNIA